MTERLGADRLWIIALTLPLLVRLHADGAQTAAARLLLLGLALGLAYGWGALFARSAARPLGPGLPGFAMAFVVMLPGPVGWVGAALALSFGAVLGREIFGGRSILPPALIALAFGAFSFPAGGFEERAILSAQPDILFALACLPGGAILLWRGMLAWQVAVGAVVGTVTTALVAGGPSWWDHPARGAFAAGVLFLAAAPESAVPGSIARWTHGLLVGAMIVAIRVADPDQPDGVVYAALLGALFAPLVDRVLGWRPRHG